MEAEQSCLRPEWRTWLAENLALGVEPSQVETALVAAGATPELVRRELAEADAHPYVLAAREVGRRQARLEALLDLYSALHHQSGAHQQLERCVAPTPEEFFRRYYFAHRPVIIDGWMDAWPARQRWSLSYLRERFGHAEVEVMTGRNANPDYASEHDRHRTLMSLQAFIARIESAGETNDFYMVPRNANWEREDLQALREDLRAPEGVIDPALEPRMLTLLLGPAGTVTPLHHDNVNVLFAQVFGRKRVRLIPSFQRHRVYPHHGTFSHVDVERPDVARFPAFAQAHVVEAVLEPGQMLFIPVGWWHHVRALEVSASVTFHHFVVPEGNTYLRFT